ncbi:hypothetical protein D8X55_02995 [Malacoplasma penetrans]|uniref:hypothetical protein n=1 Tax=Malacoplasma penetrans TaxID=28227 RepID=UPI0010118AAD|nr:hypothetical protein [Malacoplasma penetrans]RXY96658.1 hypothetical protein D8X55_02995 [Malacoplasma penetrans]
MNKSNAFIPKLSFRKTVNYIEKLREVIFNWFTDNGYRIITLDLPVSTNISNKLNSDSPTIRPIDFDSTKDYSIYEIINSYDNLIRYMYYYYEPENDVALFSKYYLIDRDVVVNGILKESLIYNFEVPFKESDRTNDPKLNNLVLKEKLESIWKVIFEFAKESQDTQEKEIQKDFDWCSSHLINLSNPLSSFNKGLYRYVKSRKMCGIFYKEKNFKEKFNHNFLQSYDANNTVSLYAWFKEIGEIDELITLAVRPNWEVLQKQNNNIFSKEEFRNDFIDITENGLKGISLSIKIHLDKLAIYLLSKNLLEEIPSKLSGFALGNLSKLSNIK